MNDKGKGLKLTLGAKLISLICIVFILLLIAVGLVTITIQDRYIAQNAEDTMQSEITNIYNLLDIQIEGNQKLVNTSLILAHNYFYSLGRITQAKATVVAEAKNQVTNDTKTVTLPVWNLGGKTLQRDTSIVDTIQSMSVPTATIFQKVDGGYLRISTNVKDLDGTRATGTYIPDSSEVIKTIESGKTYYGRAFVVTEWYLTAYEPIYVNGQIDGILYVGAPEKDMAQLKTILHNKKFFTNGYPYLVATDGTFIIHPNAEGKKMDEHDFKRITKTKSGHFLYALDDDPKYLYYTYHEHSGLYICVTFYKKDYDHLANVTRNVLAISMLAGAAIFGIIVFFITRSITVPINVSRKFIMQVAAGKLNAQYKGKVSNDEIGEMSSSIIEMTKELTGSVEKIQTTGNEISNLSDSISQTSTGLSERSTEQAANIEEITSNIEEITAGIEISNNKLKESDILARRTSDLAKDGGESVEQTASAMKEISENITLIEDIAYQTNLLALNAAIEAARAGENGKGFSVVASEVRKLAEKSQSASHKIIDLAENSMQIAENATAKINSIIEESGKTADNIQEIAQTFDEQSMGIRQISLGTDQLNQVSQENAESAEHLAGSAHHLNEFARKLNEVIEHFEV